MAFVQGRYFRFGGEPANYQANWNGLPPAANDRGSKELGDVEVAAPSPAPFGLSKNERRAVLVTLAGIAGYVWWNKKGPGRRRS